MNPMNNANLVNGKTEAGFREIRREARKTLYPRKMVEGWKRHRTLRACAGWVMPIAFMAATALPVARPGGQVESLANVLFQIDSRIFFVMTALEAARLKEIATAHAGPTGEPFRTALLADLKMVDASVIQPMLDYLRGRDVRDVHGHLTSLALALGPPPNFSLQGKPDEWPEEIRALANMQPMFPSFYQTSGGEALWAKYRPAYAAEARNYVPLLRDVMLETLRYFHMEARIAMDRSIVVIPDLLNAYGTAHARNINNTYYLILGPTTGSSAERTAIRHEYLHFLVDPLILKYGKQIIAKNSLLALVQKQADAKSAFRQDFFLVATESLLRAVDSRLADEINDEDRRWLHLHDQYRRGLILVFYFDAALAAFEKDKETTLAARFPELLEGISLSQEEERSKTVDSQRMALEKRLAEYALVQQRTQQEEEILRRRLADANDALQRRDFAAARGLLGQALASSPNNPSALFGLAQVEGHEQNLDAALRYYQRAIEAPGSPAWIAAWSLVRAARILLFQDRRPEAVELLQKGAAVTGDTRGAAEAARAELKKLKVSP